MSQRKSARVSLKPTSSGGRTSSVGAAGSKRKSSQSAKVAALALAASANAANQQTSPRKKAFGPPMPTAEQFAQSSSMSRFKALCNRADRDLENEVKVKEISSTLAKVAEKRRVTASASALSPAMIAGGGGNGSMGDDLSPNGRSTDDLYEIILACHHEISLLEADTAAIAVGDEMAVCSDHDGEGLIGFCLECNIAVCPVCVGLSHKNHQIAPLRDFISSLESNIDAVDKRNAATLAQLNALEAALPGDAAELHKYIDVSTAKLLNQLKLKGRELHDEVRSRQLQTLKATDAEMRQCLDDLRRLQQGQLVLGALQAREGELEFHAGKVVHGGITFDEFMEQVAPNVSAPPRLTDQLQLQLPMQSLKEVCELLTWTDASLSNQRQIFPAEEEVIPATTTNSGNKMGGPGNSGGSGYTKK